jgi:hypothetical protein
MTAAIDKDVYRRAVEVGDMGEVPLWVCRSW